MAASLEVGYFPRVINGPPFSDGEDMKFEALRLKSYARWLSFERASPIILAKAGFVYTGVEDVVQCFVCKISKGGWNRTMNPFVVHRELNPACQFCQGCDGLNNPVYVPEETIYREIQDSLHRQYCGTEVPQPTSSDNAGGSSTTTNHAPPPMNFPIVAWDAGASESSQPTIDTGRGSLGHDSQATQTSEEVAPMRVEANRSASFYSNWPRENCPDPKHLARAGFFYTGTGDRVQCAFCRGILRNWVEDDVPMEEHRRHFPMCPLVLGTDSGNVPDPTAILTANRTAEFMNVTQPGAVASDAALGIVTERPKHPQYAVEASRVSSFRNWPSGKEQTPGTLAKAGFFYAGFGDSVKCFFCDGGLRTWERGDDPWMEHARWFSRCPFVRQVKGEEFIQTALRGHSVGLHIAIRNY